MRSQVVRGESGWSLIRQDRPGIWVEAAGGFATREAARKARWTVDCRYAFDALAAAGDRVHDVVIGGYRRGDSPRPVREWLGRCNPPAKQFFLEVIRNRNGRQ